MISLTLRHSAESTFQSTDPGSAYQRRAVRRSRPHASWILVFASTLHLLPTAGMVDLRANYTGFAHVLDVLRHLILPGMALSLTLIPYYFRIARTSVIQVGNEDFITTLRAAGMPEERIYRKYVFRNAILPVVTVFGIQLAYIVSGSAIVEIVFSWPGMGSYMMTAISRRDYPTLMGIYFVISVAATLLLWSTPIHGEEPAAEKLPSIGTQFVNCFRLLGVPVVLLSFLGIMCHVGIDVGTNTTAPKLLIERTGMTLDQAGFATSLYFIFRTIGCLTGSFFLRVMKTKVFFIISVVMMALSMVLMFGGNTKLLLYAGIALVGYGNSNIFSMCFAQALTAMPAKQNEVSGLMIMGLFGGTVFPLIMGFMSDAMGQAGAVAVMAVGVLYLVTYIKQVKQ